MSADPRVAYLEKELAKAKRRIAYLESAVRSIRTIAEQGLRGWVSHKPKLAHIHRYTQAVLTHKEDHERLRDA